MKNIVQWLFVVAIGISVCGCSDNLKEMVNGENTSETFLIDGLRYREVEYDGCRYIKKVLGYSSGALCHKGTCTNPIHNK